MYTHQPTFIFEARRNSPDATGKLKILKPPRAWVSSTPLGLHTAWNRSGRILQCYSETLQQSKETSLSKRKKAPAVQPFNLSNIPMPDRGLSRFEAVAVMPPFCIVFVPAQPRSRRRRAVCQAPGNASGKHTLRSARVSQQRILCVLELLCPLSDIQLYNMVVLMQRCPPP